MRPSRPRDRALVRVRRPTLLVVEDDPDQQILIERAALAACPEVVIEWAPDAATAIDALGRRSFDLVLADYLLEDSENGWWVLEECRRLQPDARIALESSLPLRPPEWKDCPFLRKPFDPATCRRFLARHLAP